MPKYSNSKPWERQKNESAQAFEAFSIYLEMGTERSLRAVTQKLLKSYTLISRWSRTYNWVKRAAAYDAELQRQAYDATVKRARKMADRHIRTALKMQEKALIALEELDPADLSPRDMLSILRDALKLERVARSALIVSLEKSIGEYEEDSDGKLMEDVVIYVPENGRGDST